MGIRSQPDRYSHHDHHSDHNTENLKNSLHTLILPYQASPAYLSQQESNLHSADSQQATPSWSEVNHDEKAVPTGHERPSDPYAPGRSTQQ